MSSAMLKKLFDSCKDQEQSFQLLRKIKEELSRMLQKDLEETDELIEQMEIKKNQMEERRNILIFLHGMLNDEMGILQQ